MDTTTTLTVGAVARLAGVTVRTLHHYDEVGLISPRERTDAGYRLYGQPELERLQEVLFFRELGFGLDEIKRIVDHGDYQRGEALRRQRELLEARAGRLLDMIEAIDRAIQTEEAGMELTPEDLLEVFGDFDPAVHAEEASDRWSTTDSFAESTRRVNGYSREDWLRLSREADQINQELLALMDRGVAATDPEPMDLAERHRDHITKWFYDCTPETHAGLGELYLADERFAANIDAAGVGLARYLAEAIAANARRHR